MLAENGPHLTPEIRSLNWICSEYSWSGCDTLCPPQLCGSQLLPGRSGRYEGVCGAGRGPPRRKKRPAFLRDRWRRGRDAAPPACSLWAESGAPRRERRACLRAPGSARVSTLGLHPGCCPARANFEVNGRRQKAGRGPVWDSGWHPEGAGGVGRTVSRLPAMGDVLDPRQCVSRELLQKGTFSVEFQSQMGLCWPVRSHVMACPPRPGRGQMVGEDVDQLVLALTTGLGL